LGIIGRELLKANGVKAIRPECSVEAVAVPRFDPVNIAILYRDERGIEGKVRSSGIEHGPCWKGATSEEPQQENSCMWLGLVVEDEMFLEPRFEDFFGF
jgi:hypothetical protein